MTSQTEVCLQGQVEMEEREKKSLKYRTNVPISRSCVWSEIKINCEIGRVMVDPEFSNVLGTISATQDTELSMGFILYGSEMAKATCSNPVTVTTKNYLKH